MQYKQMEFVNVVEIDDHIAYIKAKRNIIPATPHEVDTYLTWLQQERVRMVREERTVQARRQQLRRVV